MPKIAQCYKWTWAKIPLPLHYWSLYCSLVPFNVFVINRNLFRMKISIKDHHQGKLKKMQIMALRCWYRTLSFYFQTLAKREIFSRCYILTVKYKINTQRYGHLSRETSFVISGSPNNRQNHYFLESFLSENQVKIFPERLALYAKLSFLSFISQKIKSNWCFESSPYDKHNYSSSFQWKIPSQGFDLFL